MESFANIVYAVLPYALIFLALVCLAILILHFKMRSIENQPKEGREDGTDNNGRASEQIDIIRRN